mmetsp:Transcript_30718/g.62753  ORF Transcript_30718/g.62753 Transcript_30718/m.62753 type:complete len:925 (-) Transcript_30718:66-2840(-)
MSSSSQQQRSNQELLSRLKFRVVQPVDIPRCHELESSSYPPKEAASKSELQSRQHHAAPFFRCVLLKSEDGPVKVGSKKDGASFGTSGGASNGDEQEANPKLRRKDSTNEACHHVHHSSCNSLIGYICATRCHDFAPIADMKASVLTADGITPSHSSGAAATTSSSASHQSSSHESTLSLDSTAPPPPQSQPHTALATYYNSAGSCFPYPSKHEPNGPILAIHSLVIQEEYRRMGIARALLENYIHSIELWNGQVDAENKVARGKMALSLASFAKNGYSSGGVGNNKKRSNLSKHYKKKKKRKIDKIVLVVKAHLIDFFISMGFRWRATVSLGVDPLYELERDVKSVMVSSTPTAVAAPTTALSNAYNIPSHLINSLESTSALASSGMEQDCYLVDAFAHPRKCGSGNSAAIVVLQNSPTQIVMDHYNNLNEDDEDNTDERQGMTMNDQLNELLSSAIGDEEEEEEELAEMRAEIWMHYVAREFNQPATAFVWRVEGGEDDITGEEAKRSASDRGWNEIGSHADNNMTMPVDESEKMGYDFEDGSTSSAGTLNYKRSHTREIHHYIRFFTRAGIEVDMCAHATLACASVLFRRYAVEHYQDAISQSGGKSFVQKETILVFHSRNKDIVLHALRAPSSSSEDLLSLNSAFSQLKSTDGRGGNPNGMNAAIGQATSLASSFTSPNPPVNNFLPTMPAIIRIAMDYPWRTVDPVPPGRDGQVAVIAMLRRAFFGAWSVMSPEEDDDDQEMDELAFSLSVHHVLFIGVTKGGEDLLIELTVEGFDLICGRNVDYVALKQGWSGYSRGVIICCEVPETLATKVAANESWGTERRGSTEETGSENQVECVDFRSRYFEPKVGVNEDPVSGWPHCALGPYFGLRRGKQRLLGVQESERTGLVECILKEEEQKVCIIGSTVTTVSGKLQMNA